MSGTFRPILYVITWDQGQPAAAARFTRGGAIGLSAAVTVAYLMRLLM
jgi:hypothetical protein